MYFFHISYSELNREKKVSSSFESETIITGKDKAETKIKKKSKQ